MRNRSAGMTLIELMTALLVLSILVGIAVPSFREFAANSRVSAASSSLTTALSLARSEALRTSAVARACPTTNQTGCANSTNWSTGWLVFADRDGDSTVDADELVQVWPAVAAGITVQSTANMASYNPMGMNAVNGGSVTFTVTPSVCHGRRIRESVMSPAGSVQSTQKDCP